MPPAKRTAQEANIFEDANPISKQKLVAQAQLAGRGRRANGTANGNGNGTAFSQVNNVHSSLKDLANVSEAVAVRDRDTGLNGSVDWLHEDRTILIKYRDAYRLPSSTPFHNASAQYILATGIGPRSPTMARERVKQRSTKDELAAVVRKHFKDTSVAENDCLIEVMYRVKTKDKAFRLKFAAKPAR